MKVRLKIRGVEVEIEANPNQIHQAIKEVISGIENLPVKEMGRRREITPASCKEAIELLWREGWFSEPKRLYDVWRELSDRGYNYDRSAIAHALNNLTKEGILTRMGRARRYRYVQKKPYVYTT